MVCLYAEAVKINYLIRAYILHERLDQAFGEPSTAVGVGFARKIGKKNMSVHCEIHTKISQHLIAGWEEESQRGSLRLKRGSLGRWTVCLAVRFAIMRNPAK